MDTADGLAEMIQSIVSTDEATLYLDVVQPFAYKKVEGQHPLIIILLHPNERVYVVDLSTGAGLDTRQDFALVQLEAVVGRDDLARRRSLEVGRLPSLRGILESPSVIKVVFDSGSVAAALSIHYGVSLRGLTDLQLMELIGRPLDATALDPRLAFHRKFVVARPHRRAVELRDLRACLE